jgi:hypothetical protein
LQAQGLAVQVQWKLIAEDTDGVKASYLGNTTLDASSIPANQFVPLNDVTSAQVITWLQDVLAGAEQDRINKQLDARIERKKLRTIKPNW